MGDGWLVVSHVLYRCISSHIKYWYYGGEEQMNFPKFIGDILLLIWHFAQFFSDFEKLEDRVDFVLVRPFRGLVAWC